MKKELNKKGQALVEFAIIFVIFVVLLIGIIDVGRNLYTTMNLNLLAQESSRLGSLGSTDTEIEDYIEENFKLGQISKMTITISPDGNTRSSGDLLNIKITYDMTYLLPGMGLALPDQLSTEATIRVE